MRLEKLELVGNRLSRLRRTTGVLARLECLKDVDLRNNVFTLGFYALASTAVPLRSAATTTTTTISSTTITTAETHPDADAISPYSLPPTSAAQDSHYRERLDTDTKLRRRVYEMLMASGCKSLKRLDGLDFQGVERKDWVWERLVALGVVRKREQSRDEGVEQEYLETEE